MTRKQLYDAETIRACGELLRFAVEARPAPENVLLTRMPRVDRGELASMVRSAFAELSSRQREIVMRCEIKGERYAAVAKAMHLSERQVFRERRAALNRIAQRLLTLRSEETSPALAVAADALEARIALGEVLENGGHWQAAAEVFERLAGELTLPQQRYPIEARVALLYRDADQFAQAYHHAGLATTLAARVTDDGGLARVEADVALAGVAAASGDWNLADALAQQSIDALRPLIDAGRAGRAPAALAQALLLKAELLADNGGVDQAVRLASEACGIVERNHTDATTEISARTMYATTSSLLAKDSARAEELLRECYRAALAAGLIRGSLIIAISLLTHYRLNGRPADATRLLAPLIGAARIAGSGWVEAGVLTGLVSASFDAGALAAAAAYTEELSKFATGNPLTQAAQEMSRAQLDLVHQEFKPALEHARAGEAVYGSVGLARYVGISLRMQAEALFGMGESEPAKHTIAQAVDVLRETDHPRPLASAYRTMARITGRPQYATAARKLLRECGQ